MARPRVTEPRGRLKALRRRINDRLDTLDWPVPFELSKLLDQIAAARGKPISLLATPLPGDGPGGLVIERGIDIVIVYDENLPPLQQEHIVMHEAAHVLFGHRGVSIDDLTDDRLSDLDPEVVEEAQRFAQRHGYRNADEKVAEIAAALMWLRAGAARSLIPTRVSSPEIAAANARMAAALMRGKA